MPKGWRTSRDLSLGNIIGDINKGLTTRSSLNNFCRYVAFVFHVEPKSIEEALLDKHWLLGMQEELNQQQQRLIPLGGVGYMDQLPP